jgi:hypothetical protein
VDTYNRSKLCFKCVGTCAQTRFHLSAKWTSPSKSVGTSVQLTTGSRGVHISSSNAGYTKFRGSVKSTGYPLHLPVSPSLPMCHHVPSHFNWTVLTKGQRRKKRLCSDGNISKDDNSGGTGNGNCRFMLIMK